MTGVPLVLHGGSGLCDEDFTNAIKAGISIIHINTEIRVAYDEALKVSRRTSWKKSLRIKFSNQPSTLLKKLFSKD